MHHVVEAQGGTLVWGKPEDSARRPLLFQTLLSLCEMRRKPRSGEIPIPLQCGNRDAEHFRCVGFGQAAEEAQLNDFRGTWIEILQPDQGFIKGQKPLVQSQGAAVAFQER